MAIEVTPKILSSSSFEQNAWGSFNVSIGFMHNTFPAADYDSPVLDSLQRDTTKVSRALTAKALRKIIGTPSENAQIDSEIRSDISETLSVYPNPFVDRLTLLLDASELEFSSNLQYTLLDITGNVFETGELDSGEKEIVMGSMPKGIYVLALFQKGHEIKSFKLIKTDR